MRHDDGGAHAGPEPEPGPESGRLMRRGPVWRRWRLVFRRDPRDEIEAELAHHVEERVRDHVARGMAPEEARLAVRERLGDLDRVREECAGLISAQRLAERRRVRLGASWLDVKLGARMLMKYPGLSLVSVAGMAVAIATGAGVFAFIQSMLDPSLPLEEGDRIVAIQNNRADRPGNPQRQALHDFVMWREELRSVRDLSAFRTDSRNLVAEDGRTELVRVAEMSAAGFRVARVPAHIGRTLVDEDERPGGAPVAVIAYDEWQRIFDGDPAIVGRTIRLGETVHTVVGVMPAGFRFPVNHRYWIPIRLDPAVWDRRANRGPSIEVFGRLADGVTLGQARAELAVIGQRMAEQFPETHGHLRPTVLPYTHPAFDVDSPLSVILLHAVQVVVGFLLILIAVNVAILVYARTATRSGEIAVRTALGASRGRVLSQLFVEGLVLSVVAAAIGLGITVVALGITEGVVARIAGDRMPFWWSLDLSPGVLAYVAGLAALGGAIVGVLPALKVTGRGVHAGLQQFASRSSGMQLGRIWSTLIIVQVALAVALLPGAVFWPGAMMTFGAGDPGYAIDEFARGYVSMERVEAPPAATAAEYERALQARFADRAAELKRRLQAADVAVTFASSFPGEQPSARIEVEGATTAADRGVRVSHVGVELFDLFDVPILAGRGFVDSDTRDGSTAVIVDRTFADAIGGRASAIGRRVRYLRGDGLPDPDQDRWYEIVGIVPAFPEPLLPKVFNDLEPTIYHAAAAVQAPPGPAALSPSTRATLLIARVRGRSATSALGGMRDIAAGVDPALQLHELTTAAESQRTLKHALRLGALAILLLTGSVLLLSAAGIYAMMSFTVARRRREIGIRSALGADPRRILTGIFARAGIQIGGGIAIGLLLAMVFEWGSGGAFMGGRVPYVLPPAAAVILLVGLTAALGPARRGLLVQPIEVLRED